MAEEIFFLTSLVSSSLCLVSFLKGQTCFGRDLYVTEGPQLTVIPGGDSIAGTYQHRVL